MASKILGFYFYLCSALVFFTAMVSAQDAEDWYPLEPGDTWIYQKEALDGDMTHPDVERWTTVEKITSAVTIPELAATMVTKNVKVLSDVLTPGFLRENDSAKREPAESRLLVRQNCVYLLSGPDANGASDIQVSPSESVSALDLDAHIRPGYRDELLRGDVPPDFCFPMVRGRKWGDAPEKSPAEEYVWRVSDLNADPFGPQGGDTLHLSSYLGSGTPIDRWFVKGVGVVQEIVEHHGTYEENRRLLLSATIHGKTQNDQLTPARTIPLSAEDCNGPGWQHFARSDGIAFRDVADCVSYSSVSASAR